MVTRYAAPRQSLRRQISSRPAKWRERAFATTLCAAPRNGVRRGDARRQLRAPHRRSASSGLRAGAPPALGGRSGAHVREYAPLRCSRKPRQKPSLAGGQPAMWWIL